MARTLSNIELLRRLVAFDSTSCNSNVPIADFICDYLDRPNIEIVRNEDTAESKVNLVVRVCPDVSGFATAAAGKSHVGGPHAGESGGLILSGHMDVVPATEPEWNTDPFELSEADDVCIGRGTSDMKGFIALAMNLAATCAAESIAQPLVLILTYDEELGLLGAQHLADTWDEPFPLPKSAIIGEPTSLRVVRMHKGHLVMRIICAGKSAHSGYPRLGHSAVEPAARIITALSDLRGKLETVGGPNGEFFPEAPFVALNVGTVRGGSAVNIIPDNCLIELGVRLLPDMTSGEIIERIENVVHAASSEGKEQDEQTNIKIEVVSDSPPMVCDESSRLHRCLCDLTNQAESLGVSYATDAGVLQRMGIECVLFGPGWIEVAHKPNECIPKKEIVIAERVLAEAARRLCGVTL